MDEAFIRRRITELRLKKKGRVRISNELGFRAKPQLHPGDFFRPGAPIHEAVSQYLRIFRDHAAQFFDSEEVNPQLMKKGIGRHENAEGRGPNHADRLYQPAAILTRRGLRPLLFILLV